MDDIVFGILCIVFVVLTPLWIIGIAATVRVILTVNKWLDYWMDWAWCKVFGEEEKEAETDDKTNH